MATPVPVLFLWTLIGIHGGEVDPTPQGSPAPDTVVAGVLADWPPQYTTGPGGRPAGFAVDVMDDVAERAHLAVRYRIYPSFPALLDALEAGEIDLIPNVGILDERRGGMSFTRPVETFAVRLFVRRASGGIEGPGDLVGRRVAVVESNAGRPLVEDWPGVVAVEFGDVRAALFALLSAEVDGLLYPEPVILRLAGAAGVGDEVVAVGPVLREVHRAIAVGEGSRDLLARLDGAVADLLASPGFPAIYERWHRPPPPYWTVRRVLLWSGVVLTAFVVALLLWHERSLLAANRELLREKERFRSLAESLTEGVLIADPEGAIRYANAAAAALLGASPDELVGRPVPAGLPAPSGLPVEIRGDGDTGRWMTARTAPYRVAGEPAGTVVTLTDVTERRAALADLHFRGQLLDSVGEAVVATDVGGRITYMNRRAEELYGWSAEELNGTPVTGSIAAAGDEAMTREAFARLAEGERWSGDVEVRRKDGTSLPAHVTEAPITGEDGEIVGFVGVSSDLTERKRLERQLVAAQKMEAIGRLAGGVAHDFNNLLVSISGFTSLVHDDLPPDHPGRADLKEVLRNVERASSLTGQLLAFGRRQVLRPKVLEPGVVISDLARMLERLIGADVRLLVTVDPGSHRVHADPVQIEQVVVNLVTNARAAMPGGGTIRVRVGPADGDDVPDDAETAAGRDWVRIAVADEGPGIPEEARSQIFEPFFTTRQGGTGLGLATVFGIVAQSGGTVRAGNGEEGGALFEVFLPAVADDEGRDEAEADADGDAGSPPGGAECVLVVEDEPAVRALVRRVLAKAGYRVLDAPEGAAALELAGAHPGEIDLLLTDVVMPGMAGPELADRLRATRPDIRVAFMSGYVPNHASTGPDAPPLPFLQKPFTPASLLAAVRAALDDDRTDELPTGGSAGAP